MPYQTEPDTTVIGTIHRICDVHEFKSKRNPDKTYRTRTIVLAPLNKEDPNILPIVFGDFLQRDLQGFRQGDEVAIGIQLRGREWKPEGAEEPRYFSELRAVSIALHGGSDPAPETVITTEEEIPF